MFGKKPTHSNLPVLAEDNILQRTKGSSVESVNAEEKKLFAYTARNQGAAAKQHSNVQAHFTDSKLETAEYLTAKKQLTDALLDRLDFTALRTMPDEVKKQRVHDIAGHILYHDVQIPLTAQQVEKLKDQAVDDLLGFGPIEVLMSDQDVADIMINGHDQIYIEKKGKILLTDITFGSEKHLINVVQKIVSIVGRRIDESSPMVDARMPDGSRFNAIIPPLALDGSLVSIRKFRKQKMALQDYVSFGSMSQEMSDFLAICGQIRLNIIISGGTGSGKTTLLNAISGFIDHGERVITAEDAAELQLQQPHVLRLETRPANMEGVGEVTQRQLVRNALRMRPDRIIIGEIRGDEVIDVLSAMNTGHDGSMATIHANSPKDALSRIENLVGMSAVQLSVSSLRTQIASAVQLIVQVARQRDGGRRIVQIDEIAGIENDRIIMRNLFSFKAGPMDEKGRLTGSFVCSGEIPSFITQAEYFGRDEDMRQALRKQG